MGNASHSNRGDWRPIPDPTLLTNELVEKAIANLESKLQSRFEAMDKATALLHDDYVRVPTEMDRRTVQIRELMEAKIETVTALNTQRASAAEIAVAAALQAAKEAVNAQNIASATAISKSESSVGESLRQLRDLFASEVKAINAKVDDLRVTRDTHSGSEKSSADNTARLFSVLAILAAVIVPVIIALVAHH